MKKIIWGIQAVFFYLFTWAMAAIPKQLYRFAGRITMFRLLTKRREIALENIRLALPFMKRHPSWTGQYATEEGIALATFINLGTSIVEICRLYHGKGDILINNTVLKGLENFKQAREGRNGVICVSGHCGNWELMSLSFNRHFGETVWAIARKQNNPYLNAIVEKMRMNFGNKVIYNKSALRPILSVIRNNGVIGMLADRAVFEHNGVLIEFLGRTAWANKAPVIIAHKTGVPLVPVFGYHENDHHVLTMLPEYTLCGDRTEEGIKRDIQELARYLEDFICAHPADWYWVHRRWKRAGEPVK